MVQRMCLYIDVLTDNFIDGYFASARNSKSLAGAANDRFFLVAGVDTEQEMGEIMRKHFVELRETGRSDLSGPIPAYDINNGKSKKVLGVSYRSLEDTIVDTVESLKAVVSNQQIGVEASL